MLHTRSPLAPPSTVSNLTSPIASLAKSPNFVPQTGAISPSFGPTSQQPQQLRPQHPLRTQFAQQRPNFTQHHPLSSAVSSASGGSNGSVLSANSATRENANHTNYYPSPFQNHYDQLGKQMYYSGGAKGANRRLQSRSTMRKQTCSTKTSRRLQYLPSQRQISTRPTSLMACNRHRQ
jgi:hypothetical protein